jgi:hypothetical protein
MESAMDDRQSNHIAKGNLIVPSHDPLAGVDEKPIDAGAASGAQLPDKTGVAKPHRPNRRTAERGAEPGFDPDEVA